MDSGTSVAARPEPTGATARAIATSAGRDRRTDVELNKGRWMHKRAAGRAFSLAAAGALS
jgi:hypothetical protein